MVYYVIVDWQVNISFNFSDGILSFQHTHLPVDYMRDFIFPFESLSSVAVQRLRRESCTLLSRDSGRSGLVRQQEGSECGQGLID